MFAPQALDCASPLALFPLFDFGQRTLDLGPFPLSDGTRRATSGFAACAAI